MRIARVQRGCAVVSPAITRRRIGVIPMEVRHAALQENGVAECRDPARRSSRNRKCADVTDSSRCARATEPDYHLAVGIDSD